MGLDQRIWAEIEINGTTKKVAIHSWRKEYDIDEWFFSLLPPTDQVALQGGEITVWACPLTVKELDMLEAKEYALAFQLGFCTDLIWRCRVALQEGFTLTYVRDC